MDIFIILDWIARIFRKDLDNTPTYQIVGLTIIELLECLVQENKIARTNAYIIEDIVQRFTESAESGEL